MLNPIFMQRCFQLARKGEGFTLPNPMVGAVVVHQNSIIGEGYHRRCGEPHAEVNAIAAVKEQSLLSESTLYVSLEPCAHQGKTPPCAALIIASKIPRVVVATRDPNPKVAGKGIEMMRRSGIDVSLGMLEEEARELNRAFFVNQLCQRPYIILKWAESRDGYMDHLRSSLREKNPVILSNSVTQSIVHKYRTAVDGILVGTRTALLDNPRLTTRKWYGNHPTRIVIDRELKIPADAALFDGSTTTLVFTRTAPVKASWHEQVRYIEIDFDDNTVKQIVRHLYNEKIATLMVEGGASLLSSFISEQIWDEAVIEQSDKPLITGVKAPDIDGETVAVKRYPGSVQYYVKSKICRNFL